MKVKVFLFLMTISMAIKCKVKEVVPNEISLNYIVTLKMDSNPKELEKDITYKLIEYKKVNKTLNQYSLYYTSKGEKENKLRAELLNHDLVINIFDPGATGNSTTTNSKKAKVDAIKTNKKLKQ